METPNEQTGCHIIFGTRRNQHKTHDSNTFCYRNQPLKMTQAGLTKNNHKSARHANRRPSLKHRYSSSQVANGSSSIRLHQWLQCFDEASKENNKPLRMRRTSITGAYESPRPTTVARNAVLGLANKRRTGSKMRRRNSVVIRNWKLASELSSMLQFELAVNNGAAPAVTSLEQSFARSLNLEHGKQAST